MSFDPTKGTTSEDPQDSIEAATGKYSDAAANLPQTSKILQTPQGTDPQPFRNMREATGSR